METIKQTEDAGGVVQGDRTMFNIQSAIHKFPLHQHQLKFTNAMINSQLKQNYRTDIKARELSRFKKENLTNVMINCPPLCGKTYTTAIFAACSLATVPGCKIVVYCPGQRQCGFFMSLVHERLDELRGHGYLIEPIAGKNNRENLWVKADGDIRSMIVLPANSNTVRDTGATLIICEEAAAMETTFLNDVVLPVTDASCVFITTKGHYWVDVSGRINASCIVVDLPEAP